MAFGFGFNKAKVLASAEKHVQQGKLTHAISEYEKIIERDPKDLTVLNTIGDLYARLGQGDKAGEYFKRVGDAYAAEGFTVKAIAMYKKLTKVNFGNTPVIQRLAELYTQQGLYTDARQQYRLLADNCVKNNDLPGAVKIFQKMLEIEPENVSLQTKLADLYLKLDKKEEARDIYLRAAQGLYERGSVEQADQAFERVLSIDPSHSDALLMRSKIALDAGNGAAAAALLEQVPDIDSRADGLRSLLRAYILSNHAEGAEGIARKLALVHNDVSGIRAYADFLLASSNCKAALNIFDEYIDQLVVGDSGELVIALQGLTGHLKEDPDSLERLRAIFERAGATANIPEVNELLAHAYVQTNQLAKARDLYKELADLETSNPQHLLNYRQVLARMGEEPTARPLAATEGEQALFIEEIDSPPPPIHQDYPVSLEEKIGNVLTDSELFESYNKPQQALAPLEEIHAKVPRDVRVNQRLLSVYQRLERYEDAARCCDTLKDVYHQANLLEEARKYAEMATRFRERAGVSIAPESSAPIEAPPEMPVVAPEPEPPSAGEVSAEAFALAASEASSLPADLGEAHEIDLSSEWEAAMSEPSTLEVSHPEEVTPALSEELVEVSSSVIFDLLEEIKFYLSQGMFEEARSAISSCEKYAPASLELAELKEQLAVAETGTPADSAEEVSAIDVDIEAPPLSVQEEPATEEDATVVEYDFAATTAETVRSVESESVPSFEVAPPTGETADAPVPEPQPVSLTIEPEVALPVEGPVETGATPHVHAEPEVAEELASESVTKVEEPAAETREPECATEPKPDVATPASAPEPALAEVAATPERDVLADFVLDLEEALPADFGAPPPPAQAVAAAAGPDVSASIAPSVSEPASAPAALTTAPPVMSAANVNNLSSLNADDTSNVLSELFAEFKEEVGEALEEADDPETHYNLGVAFKEMGLLDEAIGELQKVCKSIDRGVPFNHVMQAYTWLAGCFVEKGVPEASIKWYSKALTVSNNEESRTAIHYDLASAYEAAGDRPQALKHFTEVYGTNIDYRDVADRIKALKA